MNILEAEDMIKGLPDDALYQQAQSPNGQVPQYLVVSEIQRRTDMRKKYAAAQPNNGSVKDQILQQGIASMAPPMAQPMAQPMPQAMPPQGAPAQPMPQPMAPQGMAAGGIVALSEGGAVDVKKRDYEELKDNKAVAYFVATGQSVPESMLKDLDPGAAQRIRNAVEYGIKSGGSIFGSIVNGLEANGLKGSRSKENGVDTYTIGKDAEGMAAGGIVRLATGGLTGMPGEYALAPLMEKAKILARTTGRDIEDIYNELQSQAEELKYQSDLSRPNLSMLAPATGPTRNRPEVMQSAIDSVQGIGMTDTPDLSGVNQLPRDLNTQSINFTDTPNLSGVNQLPRDLNTQSINFQIPDTPDLSGFNQLPRDLVGAPRVRKPQPVSPSYGYLSPALEDMYSSMFDPQNSTNPDLSSALEAAVNSTTDASSKQEAPGITGLPTATPPPATDKSLQGGSPIQKQALSFDDLIAQSKSESMSNALIQLGAGIAGGNLSQGISASGLALTEGNKNARDLAMAQRIQEAKSAETASDRAFRANESRLDREARQTQFDDELEVLRSKVEATIDVSDATSRRAALNTYAAELEALAENKIGLTEADKLRMSRLRALIDSYATSVGMQLPALETQPTPLLSDPNWFVIPPR